MKFIYADSMDFIDPRYDFATDTHGEGRQLYWDDKYPHEYMSPCPYDGLLVSRGIVGDHRFAGRYTPAQAMRFRRVGARTFLRFRGPGLDDKPVFGDCGAFSYMEEDLPPYTSEEMLEFYIDAGFSHGCSVDHVVLEFDRDASVRTGGSENARRRYEITQSNARDFLAASRRFPALTPLGVVQGWSPESKAEAASELEAMGYTYLAVGGMVPLNAKSIHLCLQAIRERLNAATRLHLLGFAKAEQIGEFVRYGIESFDSTSPLLRAFKDARANYYVRRSGGLDYYAAIRIPQSTENPRLMRAAKEGRHRQEDLIALEQTALRCVRAFDKGTVSLEETVDAVLAYNRVFMWNDRLTGDSNERALANTRASVTRTLEDRPWKECDCDVCGTASVEVIIFRSSNRNKRRGFHNLGIYYDYVRRQIDVPHDTADLDLPSRRCGAEC